MAAAIVTRELTKRYGSTVALDALDLTIEAGEVFGYLGPNGAGKSTTIELLLGFIRPTAGSATILGFDVGRDATALHRRLAYVPSVAALWPSLTGDETLRLLGNLHGSVDLSYRNELIERFELDVDKKCRAYSHGNQQKVLLVAAFASRAELLLLDEPTTGLDPLMEQKFRLCVAEAKERGQTVLLSSHILSEVQRLCTRVGIIREGRIVEISDIRTLQQNNYKKINVTADGLTPQVFDLPGVTNIQVENGSLHFFFKGDINLVLHKINSLQVIDVSIEEPTLEEIFMHYYE